MENLRIYQTSLQLVKEIYGLISANNKLKQDFALNDQLKRAAISIVLNIAEGNGRGKKFFQNFLRIAAGSTNEVIAALQIITTVHKINTEKIQSEYTTLAKQISAFSRSFSS